MATSKMSNTDHTRARNVEEIYRTIVRGWLGSRRRNLGIVVVGEAGQGKSSLINGILGKQVARIGTDLKPGTTEVEKFAYTENGVDVNLWDTPGFGVLSEKEDEEIMKQIQSKCEIDLVLFCVKMIDTRWPKRSDIYTIQKMTQIFGKQIWRYCQFVLTFANEVKDDIAVFNEKVGLFKQQVRDTLIEQHAIEPDLAVHIVPTGDPNIHAGNTWSLPGIDDWFDNFWLECTSNMRQAALPTLIRLNRHRMHDVPSELSVEPSVETQNPGQSGSTATNVTNNYYFTPPSPSKEEGIHNRPISLHRTLLRQLEDKNSGLLQYVRSFSKGRGEQIPILGHIGGIAEGFTAWFRHKFFG